MKKITSPARCKLASVMGGGLLVPLATLPGVAGAAEGVLAEIIVTAQKRAENVQDVPISISAFGSVALQERAIGDISQLSNIAPNVTLDAGTPFSGSSSVLSAYIRGIGQNDFAFNLDPGVGVYLDGVYLARTVGANQDLLDVERIEVLKGPQGTLFGRNTIGGAISIVTREPGDEFAIQGDVTTGSYDRFDIRASMDLPLSDTLRSSLTVGSKNRKGYQRRIPFPTEGEVFAPNSFQDFKAAGYDSSPREGGDDAWNARGKLRWDAGGRLAFTLTGDYTDIDQPAIANSVLATTPVPGPFAGLAENNIPGTALDPVSGSGWLFAGLYNFCINATGAEIAARNATNLCGPRGTALNPGLMLSALASVNVDGDPFNDRLPYDDRFLTNDPDRSYADGNSFSKLKNWGFSGVLDFEISDTMALKSITAYRQMDWSAGMDLDGSPLAMLHTSFNMYQQQVSEELQLLGNALDDRLRYVVGVYYFRESGDLHDFVTFSEGLLQIDGPNDLWTENYAGFTQIDWRITDLVGVTVGGRYTREEKRFEGFQADLEGHNYKLFNCYPINEGCRVGLNFPDPNYALRYYVPGEQKKTFSNFSPRVGFQLYPADDLMFYASYSEGYKTGGWTTRLSNPLPADPVTGIVPAPDFDEETAETYEVGMKSQWLGNRVQVNAAIFKTDYNGIQLNFQQGVSPTIQNAGDAEIKGGELEVLAALGGGFTLSASWGYTDAEYTNVLPEAVVAPNPFQAGVFVGAELPKTPKNKFNLSPRYEFPLGNGAALVLLGDYTRTSRMRNDTEGTFLIERPSTDQLNASVIYKSAGGNWDLTFGGTNLTDDRFLTTGQAQIAGGQIYGTYNRPREWYMTLQVRQ